MKSYYEWARTFPALSRADTIGEINPADVSFQGNVGGRIKNCVEHRLKHIIEHPLILGGFREKNIPYPWDPEVTFEDASWEGDISFAWQGEHIGKWLHASSVLAQVTNDDEFSEKVKAVADILVSFQEEDGYLGTYDEKSRLTGPDGEHSRHSWDVWTHRYHLYGLLSAYRCFGKEEWLEACVKIGDMLLTVFGPNGKKNLAYEGTRRGLSALTLLESVVMLYKVTREERFLDLALYILYESSESRTKVLSYLVHDHGVSSVGDGKAYQLMSVLLGVVELAGCIEDPDLLHAAVNAWEEIGRDHLHLTGGPWSKQWNTVSNQECFSPPGMWSPFEGVELCSTVTWVQLNMALFRFTGDVRFFDQAERTLLNHLPASTQPDGSEGAYFSWLNGPGFDFSSRLHCCNSSAPRGWAMLGTHAYGVRENGITVNAYGSGAFKYEHDLAGTVVLIQNSDFPSDGKVTLQVSRERAAEFPLFFRIPGWATKTEVLINSLPLDQKIRIGTWLKIQREWKEGDTVTILFPMKERTHTLSWKGQDICAFTKGPVVLAAASDNLPEKDLPSAPDDSSVLEPYATAASLKTNVAVWFKTGK